MTTFEDTSNTDAICRHLLQRSRIISQKYAKDWSAWCRVVDNQGNVFPTGFQPSGPLKISAEDCLLSIREAQRWGEPCILPCGTELLIWGIPIFLNNQRVGGVVAAINEWQVFQAPRLEGGIDPRQACNDLRLRMERANLTNTTFLAAQRDQAEQEKQRAYALYDRKKAPGFRIREIYLQEEPALFAALRTGDRQRVSIVLNRVLCAILHHTANDLELAKSHFLELVVSITRTAVEWGHSAENLLGRNYRTMEELAGVTSEEDLAHWLRKTMNRVMETMARQPVNDRATRIQDALDYMQAHCGEDLSRNRVARACGFSGSHFSATIRSETGLTFTQILSNMRIAKAEVLLRDTNRSLADIALECGFNDQSYFTRVFRQFRKLTPLRYRYLAQGRITDENVR